MNALTASTARMLARDAAEAGSNPVPLSRGQARRIADERRDADRLRTEAEWAAWNADYDRLSERLSASLDRTNAWLAERALHREQGA